MRNTSYRGQSKRFVMSDEEYSSLLAGPDEVPHSSEAERAILGSILLDNRLMANAVELGLEVYDFYVCSHQYVFAAMTILSNSGREIDPLLLSEVLRQEGLLEKAGGMTFVSEITYGLPHYANVAAYAKVVKDCSHLRDALKVQYLNASIIQAREQDADEILAQVEANTLEVVGAALRRGTHRSPEFVDVGVDEGDFDNMLVSWHEGHSADAIETPLAWFNDMLEGGGLQKQGLYVLAAPPKVGKTALMLWFMNYWASVMKIPVGIISMEMNRRSLLKRLFSQYTGIPLWMFRKGLRGPEYNEARKTVKPFFEMLRTRLFIADAINTTPQFRHAGRRLVLGPTQAQVLGVDYIQLGSTSKDRDPNNRATDTGAVIGELKGLAQELNVPIIAISTLTQAPEREGRRPELTDLAWSGDLRYAAEAVCFMHNASFKKGMSREEFRAFNEARIWNIDFILAAQRNGPTGEIRLDFLKQMTQFAVSADQQTTRGASKKRDEAPAPDFNVPHSEGELAETLFSREESDDWL